MAGGLNVTEPEDSHEARKEAIDALRPLVSYEETRTTNLNTRALGIISAGTLVNAIAAFFAKDVLSGTALDNLTDQAIRHAAIWLLITAVALLATTVLYGMWTLWPRSRKVFTPGALTIWARHGDAPIDAARVRSETLAGLATYLKDLRDFNDSKVHRLRTTYALYTAAVLMIAIDAVIFFQGAL